MFLPVTDFQNCQLLSSWWLISYTSKQKPALYTTLPNEHSKDFSVTFSVLVVQGVIGRPKGAFCRNKPRFFFPRWKEKLKYASGCTVCLQQMYAFVTNIFWNRCNYFLWAEKYLELRTEFGQRIPYLATSQLSPSYQGPTKYLTKRPTVLSIISVHTAKQINIHCWILVK